MTMYKPGTQLIIDEPWAAAAADRLGFKLTGGYRTVEGTLFPHRIVVTSDGPNAAERFLPQLGDTVLAWCYPDADPQPPAMEVVHILGDCDQDWCTFDVTPDGSQIKRIIERNGIPFPQFSEVIEP